jgi:hypothetical protein
MAMVASLELALVALSQCRPSRPESQAQALLVQVPWPEHS